ncbi:hypothetical protein J5X84_24520 [Streptosporangiaceae bacterium NEAU-GS5]|nr:hypothetical protein [Streptosporangiaceae bacterium NEAU-GS5]
MLSEPEIRTNLRAWVRRKSAADLGADFGDGTPLFEGGLLRSIHVPELVLVLERLRGAPIDVEALAPCDFQDVDTMIGRFFA